MRHSAVKILFLAAAWFAAELCAMDPQEYFRLQTRSMEITLEGAMAIKRCLQKGGCTPSDELAIAESTHKKIQNLYLEADTTPAEAARYYTRHSRKLDAMYTALPYGEKLADLRRRLEEIDETIETLREEER